MAGSEATNHVAGGESSVDKNEWGEVRNPYGGIMIPTRPLSVDFGQSVYPVFDKFAFSMNEEEFTYQYIELMQLK